MPDDITEQQPARPALAHSMAEEALPAIDPTIVNPSAMVQRPGPILRWLGRAFFGAVTFDETYRNRIRDAGAIGTPVFAVNVHSLLDYLYFNFAFLKYGLPLVFFANGVNLLVFRPVREVISYLWRRVFGRLKKRLSDSAMMGYGLSLGRPCMVFLKRPKTLIQWGAEWSLSHLRDLVDVQAAIARPLILLPVSVVWDQKPEHYRRSVFDVVFGDPQAPGGLRKLFSFVLNFRRARVQVGYAIDLQEFIRSNPDAGDPDSLAARLKYALHNEFMLESKAIRGPAVKGARIVVDEVMRTRPFIDEVRSIAVDEGGQARQFLSKARAMLLKMASDFRFTWLEGFAVLLGLVFHRLFKGIVVDTDGLREVREAAREGPIVLVPAHRSHIDYLMLSVICYTHGLIPPHIAAGDNLSFWPMGTIFRRCGAFFIRRTVKGSALYAAVLRHYVRKLLKDGYWVEFFIEGTRSRTGKSLHPRYGFLSMVVDAVASGAAPDAQLVPAAVTYERVIEEKSYRAESAGGQKEKESVKALAKSAQVLGSRYGKVYVEFDHPLSLTAFLKAEGLSLPVAEGERVDKAVIRRLAHVLIHRVNQCLVVTPHNLVAFALLANPKRGMDREKLLARAGFLASWVMVRDGLLSDQIVDPLRDLGLLRPPIGRNDGMAGAGDEAEAAPEAIGAALARPLEDVLRILEKEKVISRSRHGEDEVIAVREEARPALDYYKNAMIHFFVAEALVARAALRLAGDGGGKTRIEALSALTKDLSRLFKFEFIYGAEESYDVNFDATVREFVQEHLVRISGDEVEVPADAREALDWFAGIVTPFIEAYTVIGRTVVAEGCPTDRKDVVKAAVRLGRKMFSVGDVALAESISTFTFSSALEYLESEVEAGRAKDLREAGKRVLELLA